MFLNLKKKQDSKYLKISTCPASQKQLAYMGKKIFSLEVSKFSLALQPEALVNTSGRVLFSSPEKAKYDQVLTCGPLSMNKIKSLHVVGEIKQIKP